MISAAIFVFGGMLVLSAMGPLHFALGEPTRYLHQQCVDEGFETHCAYPIETAHKYICKKLVCAQNEGDVMIAMDTGKKPDDGTACALKEQTDGNTVPSRICIKGVCRPIPKGMKLQFVGCMDDAVYCYNRKGQLFTGGTQSRPEKCSRNP